MTRDTYGLRRAVLSAVQKAGSDGLLQSSLGMPRSTSHKVLHALAAEGLVFLGQRNRLQRRWFADKDAAARWVLIGDLSIRPGSPRTILYPIGSQLPRTPPTPRPAQSIVLDGSTPVAPRTVDMARARFTQGPSWSHDARFQCAPGEQPFGAGFAAAGIGRYIE